jgi:excisionase family DNA binding protein
MSATRKSASNRPADPAKIGKEAAPPTPGAISVKINGVPVEVSPELEAAVLRAHKGLMKPLPAEMTTTEAAAFLDVSRPFVVKLIDGGELPCRMVGKHRRIPRPALEQYREKMFRRATKAADEMARISQSLGLYESEGLHPKK